MGIPRKDPAFTVDDLREEGKKFLAAGYAYWEAMHKAGMGGAIAWINDTDGHMVIFTRGEYSQQLVRNIENQGPTFHFGVMKEDD